MCYFRTVCNLHTVWSIGAMLHYEWYGNVLHVARYTMRA